MNNVVVGIAALSVCLLQGYAQYLEAECGVLSGQRATDGSATNPWLALLFTTEDIYICGGSMITQRMVLTAAHCLESNATLVVRMGPDLSSQGEKHSPDIVFRHYLYNPKTHENDIGILRLAPGVAYTGTPICISLIPEFSLSVWFTVPSWHQSKTANENADLRTLEIYRRLPSACGGFSSQSQLMCAGNLDSNQCNVVSGGPQEATVGTRIYQTGIASYSPELCQNATVYTELMKPHTDWIVEVVRDYGGDPYQANSTNLNNHEFTEGGVLIVIM